MLKYLLSDKNSNLKYMKVYNWGKTIIISGVLKYGAKFPSENILMRKFGFSRETIRGALEHLENEGLIERVRGSGTYVSFKMEQSSKKKVGLILSYLSDYFFPRLYDGIKSIMDEENIQIELAVTKNSLNEEAHYLEKFLNMNISGIIVEGTKSSFPNPNVRLYERLVKKNIPIIFIHNHYSNLDFDSIEMSDAKCSYELTKLLLENGHRKICGIFKYDDMQGIERYKGFMECMADNDIAIDDDCIRWYSTKDFDYKFSKSSLNSFYKKTKNCTAMIAYNDEIAYKYVDFLNAKSEKFLSNFSMVSFDDAVLGEKDFKIISGAHPKEKLGRLAARNIIKMLNDSDRINHNYSHKFPVIISDGNSVKKVD